MGGTFVKAGIVLTFSTLLPLAAVLASKSLDAAKHRFQAVATKASTHSAGNNDGGAVAMEME
jgi:hypothetical protein